MPAIGNEQHEEAAAEAEHPTAGERRELDHEQKAEEQGERGPVAMPSLEPQVDRQHQHEHRRELDPEVVRVARERVDAEDVLALDRAVDVDLARTAGERLEPAGVEVSARALRDGELGDAVRGVGRDAADECAEREPVELHAAARDQRDAGDEEQEVQEELHHPLCPLRERLGRLEVEPPDQVDEQERDEERQGDHGRALEPAVEALDAVDEECEQEESRHDVGERQRPGDLPLELRERDREDRREEEALEEGRALRKGARTVESNGGHGRVMVRRARCGLRRLNLEPRLEPGAARLRDGLLARCAYEVMPSYSTFHRPQPSRRTSAST